MKLTRCVNINFVNFLHMILHASQTY
jgi:hypothetical protein